MVELIASLKASIIKEMDEHKKAQLMAQRDEYVRMLSWMNR